jgi:hypothetical protein
MSSGAVFRVDSLAAGFPAKLETRLEMSLGHRRELNALIRNESATVDQVPKELFIATNLQATI